MSFSQQQEKGTKSTAPNKPFIRKMMAILRSLHKIKGSKIKGSQNHKITKSQNQGVKIKGSDPLILPQEKMVFTPPDNQEVIIDQDWSTQNGLKVDPSTGRVLVTCAEQYFSYYDELSDQDVQERDIPFLISQTGKFKKLDAKCQ